MKVRDAGAVSEAVGETRDDWRVRVKYAADRVAGVALLGALAPVFSGIALAIVLEDGRPVLFVQERPGLGGKPFGCFKFRTMLVDADRYLDADGRPTRPRVTKVGRFLRKTSLDELAQLLNIARGDMSLIGPRPPLMVHLQRYTDEQMRRFRMKPGVTGLAQVNGRNTLKWSRRLAYDNDYIDSYSLRADVRILLRTVGVVLRREGVVLDRNPGDVDDLAPVGAWEGA
ncbi:MAG: lipopolysaccharide/colanic/teichoic acid biosynthesis glycosyltransferase [Myxococcota bacterium]|jgi:lipopolysaccharide/colanic/teichoic acid biosynthesis glycosyltransferase